MNSFTKNFNLKNAQTYLIDCNTTSTMSLDPVQFVVSVTVDNDESSMVETYSTNSPAMIAFAQTKNEIHLCCLSINICVS